MIAPPPPKVDDELVKAVKWIAISSVILQYGLLMLPSSKGELKMRTNAAINHAKKVQSYFTQNSLASEERKKEFNREFNKNEVLLIGELIETVWGISEESLENIINVLKENIATNEL
jgi:hypothetical protein